MVTGVIHPDHIADLNKSGLSERTIDELGIRTILPRDIDGHIEYRNERVNSLLCFPYPLIEGFCRDKVFPAIVDKYGHSIRYLQRSKSGSHLYIPPPTQSVLNSPIIPLYFTEGEKKAAKACQERYHAIGLGGLWNFPCPEENLINFNRRLIFLVPDSDTWKRIQLLWAVFSYGSYLEEIGAFVRVLKLPQSGIAKVGLDDFLIGGGKLEDCKDLPLSHYIFTLSRNMELRRQAKEKKKWRRAKG